MYGVTRKYDAQARSLWTESDDVFKRNMKKVQNSVLLLAILIVQSAVDHVFVYVWIFACKLRVEQVLLSFTYLLKQYKAFVMSCLPFVQKINENNKTEQWAVSIDIYFS